jgi:integrase
MASTAVMVSQARGYGSRDGWKIVTELAHTGKAPLEQIQLSLGHASVVTTEIYLGVKQNLYDAPCDRLGITPASNDADAR